MPARTFLVTMSLQDGEDPLQVAEDIQESLESDGLPAIEVRPWASHGQQQEGLGSLPTGGLDLSPQPMQTPQPTLPDASRPDSLF